MNAKFHPHWYELLEEFGAEKLRTSPSVTIQPPTIFHSNGRGAVVWIQGVIIGVLVGVLLGATLLKARVEGVLAAPTKTDEIANSDVESIKKVLSSLIGVVGEMQKRNIPVEEDGPSSNVSKKIPIRVVSPKANLRSQPNRNSTSLAVIPKDTALLANELKDGWYRIQTPLGAEAWIAHDTVIEEAMG